MVDISNYAVIYLQLSDQTPFKLNKTNKIEDYSTQKFLKEDQWVKDIVNILLLLINLIWRHFFYLQQVVEYLLLILPLLLDDPIGKMKDKF